MIILKGMIYGKNFELNTEDEVVCQAIETRLEDLIDIKSKEEYKAKDYYVDCLRRETE